MLLRVPKENSLSQFEVLLGRFLQQFDLKPFLLALVRPQSKRPHVKCGHFEQRFLSGTDRRMVVLRPPRELLF